MKKQSKVYSALAVMAITTMMVTSPCFATDKEKTTTKGTQSKEVATMKGGYSILGSKLIGMDVKNPQGENLGEIKDIVIDSTGKVRYAAISYGGFLGMGDNMYAVPLEAFTFKRDEGWFYDDVIVILDVKEDQLKDEEGFNNENWPNLDDEGYRRDLDTRYNVKRDR
jgi:sporulation protein YlmC with PRC-barrel domain